MILMLPDALQAQAIGSSAPASLSLQPGDVVRIEIWREKELSGEFLVDEHGVVTLPLLGTKHVVGIPLTDLRDVLLEEYRVELRNPSITITPLRRVNILGEVGQPGLYAVDPTVSLAGAIALAGGTTSTGDMGKIRLIRDGEVLHERIGATATLTSADIRSGDQIVVLQRNWFERNTTFIVSLVFSASTLLLQVLR